MIGKRIRTANIIAKRRVKIWHPDFETYSNKLKKKVFGMLRKTNTMCSCQSCCNVRRSNYYNEEEKLTIQERKELIQNQ